MRFIGDIHGNRYQHIKKYVELTVGCDASLQVGDLGAGFTDDPLPILSSSHRFIRGNHDDPTICRAHPNWIPDNSYSDGIYFLGGGLSIDRDTRMLGRDYWDDEELSYQELSDAINNYEQIKPNIVITHEAPHEIAMRLGLTSKRPSRTSMALNAMAYSHMPALWIFGHHHRSVRQVIDGTKFICLAEMEYMDIDLSQYAIG